MHHPTDRIAHTAAFDTPVVEDWLQREIAQWVHLEAPRANALTTELHLAPQTSENGSVLLNDALIADHLR